MNLENLMCISCKDVLIRHEPIQSHLSKILKHVASICKNAIHAFLPKWKLVVTIAHKIYVNNVVFQFSTFRSAFHTVLWDKYPAKWWLVMLMTNVCMVMTHSMHACERSIINKKCRRHMDKNCIKLLTRDESEF